MYKVAGALFLLLIFPMNASALSRPDLVIGWLGYSDGTIIQALSVRNYGRLPLQNVRILCRFFREEKPIGASGSVTIANIAPGATDYNSISIKSKIPPDQADCHIASVR